jgi:hypothetical protein
MRLSRVIFAVAVLFALSGGLLFAQHSVTHVPVSAGDMYYHG